MAFIFRIKRANGPSAKFYIRYRDPKTTRVVTRAGYEDRKATEQLAARLVKEAARHAEGMGPPAAVHRGGSDLSKLRGQFIQALADKGRAAKHVRLTDQRLDSLFVWAGWKVAADLDGDRLLRVLADRRSREGESQGERRQRIRFGRTSSNHYIRAAKSFSKWLAKKTGHDPLAHVELLEVRGDRRVQRAALTMKQLGRLFESTGQSAKTRGRLTGQQRSALYQTAAMQGLRSSELARLGPADVMPPMLKLTADQKSGKEVWLPLHKKLAPILESLPAGELFWPGRWPNKIVRILHRDLKDAGLPTRTAEGRIDLQSLRVAFVTNLGRRGVHPTVAQRLARHADIRTTNRHYTRLDQPDLRSGIDRL